MLLLGVLDFLFPGSCPITRPVDCEWEPWYRIPCESCSKSCGEGTRRCKRVKRTAENMVENAMGHISRPSHAAEQCAEVYLIALLKLNLLLDFYYPPFPLFKIEASTSFMF